jgi:hypothetical protein
VEKHARFPLKDMDGNVLLGWAIHPSLIRLPGDMFGCPIEGCKRVLKNINVVCLPCLGAHLNARWVCRFGCGRIFKNKETCTAAY